MTSLVDLIIEKFDGEIVVPNQVWDKYHRNYSCNCLGYTYRRRCKHITQISDSFKKRIGVLK